VVVAVVAVRVVQPAVDEVIDVVAVRHLFVAALLVLALAGNGGARRRVDGADGDDVFVVVAVVRVVQVAVVQVIDVPVVLDARVPAVVAVDVLVVGVLIAAHRSPSIER
jgi:hypothetical protein